MASSTDTTYLEKHGSIYRVTFNVPSDLRDVLGTKLKRSLGTDSLRRANELKVEVLREFRAQIDDARGRRTGDREAVMREALEVAQDRIGLSDEDDDRVAREIAQRSDDLLGAPTEVKFDSHGYVWENYPADKIALVNDFRRVASGKALPLRFG